MLDLDTIIKELAKKRPVFHSEADFQFSLAWCIQEEHNDWKVRLEYPAHEEFDKKTYIDIMIDAEDTCYAIELKYKVSEMTCFVKDDKKPKDIGEEFNLLDQNAQDHGRFDFCKDIWRVETLAKKSNLIGYAIFLTNDHLYWKESKNYTFDSEFRIHDNRTISNEDKLEWDDNASKGTTQSRKDPISLKGNYLCKWQDYSKINAEKHSQFRYLIIEAKHNDL